MKSPYLSVAAPLLRGITDEISTHARVGPGSESVQELIGRVRSVSEQAQALMRSALEAAFPEVGWSDSEDKQDHRTGTTPCWVYDPIDGAYHYLQGLPLWSSSLALVKGGQAVLALVYDPCKRELFAAEAGKATTLNGSPVKVSAKSELQTAVAGTALPPFGGVATVGLRRGGTPRRLYGNR
jgi:myo-inositol-1(or 4)-monophosphatase